MGLRYSRRRRLLVHGRLRMDHRHSYITYGPLTAGATMLMYEGAPNCRTKGASGNSSKSTAFPFSTPRRRPSGRSSSGCDHWVDGRDLSSLRLLGSVGEGINPEAWMWYHEKIGGGRCPIVDTWWQTETAA